MGANPRQDKREIFALERAKGRTIAASATTAGYSERQGKRVDDDPNVIALVAQFKQDRHGRIANKLAYGLEGRIDEGTLCDRDIIALYMAINLRADVNLNVTHRGAIDHLHRQALTALSDEQLEALSEMKRQITSGLVGT